MIVFFNLCVEVFLVDICMVIFGMEIFGNSDIGNVKYVINFIMK